MILREVVAFNGNTIRVVYNQHDMGNKYKIRSKAKDADYFTYVTSFPTMGEAYRYADKLTNGGA